jgi:site-specific recombinase XerC
MELSRTPRRAAPWNKGVITGQKLPLKPHEVWQIRTRLELAGRGRDLALFNLAIDSKLRGCDLVRLRVRDVAHGATILPRTTVIQRKTGRPVQFEITDKARRSTLAILAKRHAAPEGHLFRGRWHQSSHISTRQYSRLVTQWVTDIGLDPSMYGTHSLRRSKPTLIYRQTKNLRAVQIMLGHEKLESTVRYLGVEVEDALEISERTEL